MQPEEVRAIKLKGSNGKHYRVLHIHNSVNVGRSGMYQNTNPGYAR